MPGGPPTGDQEARLNEHDEPGAAPPPPWGSTTWSPPESAAAGAVPAAPGRPLAPPAWPAPGVYGAPPPYLPPPAHLPPPRPPVPPRRRRGRWLAGAAAAAALLLAVAVVQRGADGPAHATAALGRSSAAPADAASTDTPAEVATRLLAGMTRAVTKGDADGFVAAAAAGHPGARAHLQDVYAGLHALPLASFGLSVDPARIYGTPTGVDVPGAFTLPALATYRLKGWDGDPVQVPLQLVVGRVNGTWGVLEDRTADDDDTSHRLEPWLFPGLQVTKTAHVLVVGERAHAAQLRRLATTLEQLVTDVRTVWPERTWNGRVVAYATTSTAFVRSWYGRTAAGDKGNGDRAAFVAKVATLRRPGSLEPGAVRMVLTPYLLQGDRPGYVDILRHEMTHVATAKLSGGVPVWLVEGAAEYTGFARRDGSGDLDPTTTLGQHGLTRTEISSTQRGSWRPTLRTGGEFYRGSGTAVDEAYNSAFITCLYIADHYGEATLRRLYQRAAALSDDEDEAAVEKKMLTDVLHTTRARLLVDVGAYASRLRNRLVFR